ncbi:hypothetical protein KHQ88_04350 [Mycoplasmatota bacterium]|nr:hypothetical protein KHQ88_04350 [Mycoplasmatota bacterium]
MLEQEESVRESSIDFLNYGVGRADYVDEMRGNEEEDCKVIQEEQEVKRKEKSIYLQLLIPVGYIVFACISTYILIKNAIGIDKFVAYGRNYIKFFLSL